MASWTDASVVDRLGEIRRDSAAVAALWPEAVVLGIDDKGRMPMTGVDVPDPWGMSTDVILGRRPSAADSTPAARLTLVAAQGPYDPERHWLLGRDGERVVFATPVSELSSGYTLREAGPLLPVAESELVAMAAALAAWHRVEAHCPTCGTRTAVAAGGTCRWCPSCEKDLFPRTDPAIIVAITDADDRLLLARQGVWATGRHSVLAGFVEAGEALEQAVHREVLEESGLQVEDVTYFGSQPWPFPRSIMLGFRARALTTDIRVDGEEIVSGRWFTRDDLLADVGDGSVVLPGEASIAFRLIRNWLDGTPD
ncbi:MAG: NAD(+) diphosphatase [Propionibacteriaceae bacterium]